MQTFDEWVISRLRYHGAYGGVMDAVPGRAMVAALKDFQQSKGIKASGLADIATVAALRLQARGTVGAAPTIPADPVWIREARRFMGLREIAGPKSNATILGWAKRFGGWVAGFYKNDDTPWCGLFVGHVISATLPDEFLPANPLSALAWGKFGSSVDVPSPGTILVFSRKGGGHVGFYVGEDNLGRYHVLGGNQSNSVSITPIDKERCVAMRWPKTGGLRPLNGRVSVSATGATSKNEA